MARVLALVPDLLFGSKVQSMLVAAGHEVRLAATEDEALAEAAGSDALVVDLTTDLVDGIAVVQALAAEGALGATRTLAFYSHVDAEVRARALDAGLDLVVPRSRMAREGGTLVDGLLAQSRPGAGT